MKKTKAHQKEKQLGMIQTKAVGLQYYDAEVASGMEVHLERECENEHDGNALRVENADFEPVGHVPAKMAAWLAPLIDAGRIRVSGRIGQGGPFEYSAPMELSLWLAPKGNGILRHDRTPESGLDALHQMVLWAYLQSADWKSPNILTDLAARLDPLTKSGILPETRLLLELLPAKASEMARLRAQQESADLIRTLRSVKIGDGLHYRNLTVFPLYLQNGHEPGYILLSKALEQELAEVTETSDSGNVPELRLVNRSPLPILIPEGEIVVGGKQNRTVNITILIAAGATCTLPVSCVEQGRWHSLSSRFQSRFHAPPHLRANKLRSVRRNSAASGSRESDQAQVWADVQCCLQEAGVSSETSSITDCYEQAAERIEDYREHLSLPQDASGVVIVHGDTVVGLDLFDHHDTFDELWPRLSEAYILSFADKDEAGPGKTETAQSFLSVLCDQVKPAKATLGLGQAYDIEGESLIGAALWHEGRACHVSAFPDSGQQTVSAADPWENY